MTHRGERMLVWRAAVAWDSVEGTDRRMVDALAPHHRVLWVDPPLSVAHAIRTGGARAAVSRGGLDEVADGVHRLTAVVPPFGSRRGVEQATALLMRRAVRGAVRSLGARVRAHVVTSPNPRFDAIPDGLRVYFATDDMVAGAELMHTRAEQVRRKEDDLVASGDLLLAVSPEIIERWGATGLRAHVLPNGCDPAHYAGVDTLARPDDIHLTGPVAGVVGQLSARLDLDLLEAVVDGGTSLLLVGPLDPSFEPARVARLLDHPGVQWVGRKSFEELPGYLAAIDVGLTPYADTAFNRGSFPLKTLEYLSAGRPAVSTPLPAVRHLGTDLIDTAADPHEFAKLTRLAAGTPRNPEAVERRRSFAREHSWAQRAETMTGLIEQASR